MNKLSVKITSSFLIFMFIVSGLTKFFTLGKSESKRLSKKLFNLNKTFSQFIVFGAGVWELIASIIILYGIWYSDKLFLQLGSLMLIIFTILAIFFFNRNNFNLNARFCFKSFCHFLLFGHSSWLNFCSPKSYVCVTNI